MKKAQKSSSGLDLYSLEAKLTSDMLEIASKVLKSPIERLVLLQKAREQGWKGLDQHIKKLEDQTTSETDQSQPR
jgi:hypothetical protein